LKVTYAEEAIADIVEAMTFLNERNPTAAASLDDQIARCIEVLCRGCTGERPEITRGHLFDPFSHEIGELPFVAD
jgi:plasmid stabilization system protein ParE